MRHWQPSFPFLLLTAAVLCVLPLHSSIWGQHIRDAAPRYSPTVFAYARSPATAWNPICFATTSSSPLLTSTTSSTEVAAITRNLDLSLVRSAHSGWNGALPDAQIAAAQFLEAQNLFSLPAIIGNFFPFLPLLISDEGNPGFLWFPGFFIPPGGGILLNGRPAIDPYTSSYNLSWISPESIEQVEIFLGSKAVVLSPFSQGIALNLRSTPLNTRYPYTRIWFAQSANFFTASDATFSINLLPTLNVFAGYRRISRENQAPNSFVDLWNVRWGLAWQPSSTHTLTITDFFTNDFEGNNGGLRSPDFDQLPTLQIAEVLLPATQQRIYRHDLTLNWQWLFAPRFSLRTTAGYSPAEWNLKHFPRQDSVAHRQDRSQLFSLQSTLLWQWNRWSGAITGSVQQQAVATDQQWTASAGLWSTLHFAGGSLSAGARVFAQSSAVYWNGGVRLTLPLSKQWTVWVDGSSAYDPHLPDSVATRRFLGIACIQYRHPAVQWDQFVLYHQPSAIPQGQLLLDSTGTVTGVRSTYQSVPDAIGIAGSIQGRLAAWQWYLQYGYSRPLRTSSDGAVSLAFAQLHLSYHFEAFKHAVHIAAFLQWRNRPFPYRWLPVRWQWVPETAPSSPLWNGLSLTATVRFSTAVVTIGINNLLNQAFYTVPIYPDRGRSLDIIVRWAMQDDG